MLTFKDYTTTGPASSVKPNLQTYQPQYTIALHHRYRYVSMYSIYMYICIKPGTVKLLTESSNLLAVLRYV